MTIADAHRVVKQVLGGYSLKIHDGAFLETCQEEIKQNVRGARLCYRRQSLPKGQNAACSTLVKTLTKTILSFTRTLLRRERDKVAQGHVRFNLQHQGVRSRVETPFA